MRPHLLGLLGLLLLVQYRLWLGEGGIRERQGLEAQVRVGEEGNQLLRERNDALARQVLAERLLYLREDRRLPLELPQDVLDVEQLEHARLLGDAPHERLELVRRRREARVLGR